MKKLALAAALAALLTVPAVAGARTTYVVPDGYYAHIVARGNPVPFAGFQVTGRHISRLTFGALMSCHSDGDPASERHDVAVTEPVVPVPDHLIGSRTGTYEAQYVDHLTEREITVTLDISFRGATPTIGIGLESDGEIEHCAGSTVLSLRRSAGRVPARRP